MRPAKTQISLGFRPVWSRVLAVRLKKPRVLSYLLSTQRRLREYPAWSESSLGTQVILLVLWCAGSNSLKIHICLNRIVNFPSFARAISFQSRVCKFKPQSSHITFMDIVSEPFSPFHWFKWGSCYWRKYVHLMLVKPLGHLNLPRNRVSRLTDLLNMTLKVLPGP